jgi:hypothetical protein
VLAAYDSVQLQYLTHALTHAPLNVHMQEHGLLAAALATRCRHLLSELPMHTCVSVRVQKGAHLAVIKLALDQVGLNAALGQGLGCAGASGAAANDCCPERPVKCRAVADGKHLCVQAADAVTITF